MQRGMRIAFIRGVKPAHPLVTDTLTKLADFLAELRNSAPSFDDDHDRLGYEATQLGVLLAGLQAVVKHSQPAARTLVAVAQHRTQYESIDVQTILDQLRLYAPIKAPVASDISQANVMAGVSAAMTAIRALPASTEDVPALSQQIGAVIGFLEGMTNAGGFDETLFEARVAAEDTVANMVDDIETANIAAIAARFGDNN